MARHEGVTRALEYHGDFFQQRCLQEIRRAGWKIVETEFPVHVAHENSAVDIWAESPAGDFHLHAIIECKRSHPDFRVWAFLNRLASWKAEFPVVYQERGVSLHPNKKQLSIFSDMRAPSLPVTDQRAQLGREVAPKASEKNLKGEYEQINRPRGRRPQGDRIAYACHQLALAVRSIVRDEVQILQHRSWRVHETLSQPRIYLPLLVTTAELLYGSLKEEEVSLIDGTVAPEGISYEGVNWLLYSYPLPEELQLFQMDGYGNQYRQGQYEYAGPDTASQFDKKLQHLSSVREVTRYKRLPILIVRGTALAECLEFLITRGWSKIA